ncbi:MAG: bile acid:sodium symporter family protein, partial [Gammaproteobacteria bacterium]|nr:bile acid:sodium symporter family protein [Gammaproteobacteria bacterium]
VHTNYEMIVNNMSTVGVATLILNVAALVLGYALARITQLKHSQTVTIGFEVGIQNGTLALVVAGTLLQNETMMIPGALYGLLMFVTGAAFSWWVNRYKKYI